ncbi:MAG TPA: hypothetical protein VGE77_04405 [Nocardioides sp.]
MTRARHDQRGSASGRTIVAALLSATIVAGLVAVAIVLLRGGGGGDAEADPTDTSTATSSSTESSEPPSEEPPTDATVADFCEIVVEVDGELEEQIDGAVGRFETAGIADDIEAVGTPDDVSDAERAGFLLYLEVLRDVDGELTAEFDDVNPYDDLSSAEQSDFDAYADYETALCR